MQIGSKGSIFLHTTSGGVKEIHEILLEGGPLSIPVLMSWTWSSLLPFYQVIADSNFFSLGNRNFDHNLL